MPKGAKSAMTQQSQLEAMWGKRKRDVKKAADEPKSRTEDSEAGPSSMMESTEPNKVAQPSPGE
jgi:hypothetical protein